MAVTLGISWLSWRLIENPIRYSALKGSQLVIGYVSVAATVAALAMTFAFSDGMPERFNDRSQPYIMASRDFLQNWSRCYEPNDGPWTGIEVCPVGPEGSPQVLIWGDSHARALKEGLEKAAFEMGAPGLLVWRGGCPPLIGLLKTERVSTPAEEAECARWTKIVRSGIEHTPSIRTILLIGRWSYYAEGTGIGADSFNWITLRPDPERESSNSSQRLVLADAFAHTLDALSPFVDRIFVLRQVPEIFNYSSRRAAQAMAYGQMSEKDLLERIGRTSREAIEMRFAAADSILEKAADSDKVEVIDLSGALCSGMVCSAVLDGLPVYFDNNHLTNTGAIKIRSYFREVFETGKQ